MIIDRTDSKWTESRMRCKSCGDLLQERKQETHCKKCLGYTYAWLHIQRAKEYLEQTA